MRGLAVVSALLQLLFLIFSVKILGEAAERIGIPLIAGEIIAGVSFGLLFLNVENSIVTFFAELGSIFLLFTAGYNEVSLKNLKFNSITVLVPTLSQMAFAFIFGFAFGRIFGFNFLESLFIGVAFNPTSIAVVLGTLIDLNYLSSRSGTAMLSSAFLDDIIALFFLSVVVNFTHFNRIPPVLVILIIAGKILLFLLLQLMADVRGELVVERNFLQRNGVSARGVNADRAGDQVLQLFQFLRRAADDLAIRARALHLGRDGHGGGQTLDAARRLHQTAGRLSDFIFHRRGRRVILRRVDRCRRRRRLPGLRGVGGDVRRNPDRRGSGG